MSKQEDTLNKIFEGMDVLNEETRAKLTKTFRNILDEAKVEQEKSIRAEMSERYAKDKKAIHSALEQFLEQELSGAVADFKSGIDEVDALKKQYTDKTVAVTTEAKKYVAARLGAIEKVIEGILRRELTELHESEKTNRRAYLNAITESKAKGEADYERFRAKGAAVLEHIVNTLVQGTLDELREDIKAAREADFGREMYETMYTTFRRQFFDSNKEFRALVDKVKVAEATSTAIKGKARAAVKEARERAQAAEGKAKRIQESVVRTRTINKMLSGLQGLTREKMKHLLEAAQTQNLPRTYRKFLPELLNEAKKGKNQTRRKKIEERVIELRTGGAKPLNEVNAPTEIDDEIVDIKRLAGMND
jgi:hypothetical protein